MLDKDKNVFKTVTDYVTIGSGKDMIKVLRSTTEAPSATKSVRLKVRKQFETDMGEDGIVSDVKIANNSYHGKPVVTGKYQTRGKGSTSGINVVCSDKSGVAYAAAGTIPSIRAAEAKDWKATFYDAPAGFEATQCYAGQN